MIFWMACTPPTYQKGILINEESSIAKDFSIEGHLFYPDLRELGHFSWRRDVEGNHGFRCSYAKDDCMENPLGAWGVEAQALDSLGRKVSSSHVRHDGSYTLFVGDDGEYRVVFFLSHCTEDVCFAFEHERGVYALAHPIEPIIEQGEGISLPPLLFQPEGIEAGAPNNHAHSANHFASLMELTFIWHALGGAAFLTDDFAPLSIILPTSLDTFGRTTGPSTVHIPENTTSWIKGNKIMHEYGHVLSLRAWGGSYWFDGEPFADWSATRPQEPHIAFKEGFANFVSRSSETAQGCTGGFDEPTSLGGLEDGWLYPRNVTKFLCDVLDYHEQGDENLHYAPSFFMELLENILTVAKETGDKELSICTLIHVWTQELDSPNDQEEIYSIAENNNIFCF